jgi:hypothetical protein
VSPRAVVGTVASVLYTLSLQGPLYGLLYCQYSYNRVLLCTTTYIDSYPNQIPLAGNCNVVQNQNIAFHL